jgi:hypothetical protein
MTGRHVCNAGDGESAVQLNTYLPARRSLCQWILLCHHPPPATKLRTGAVDGFDANFLDLRSICLDCLLTRCMRRLEEGWLRFLAAHASTDVVSSSFGSTPRMMLLQTCPESLSSPHPGICTGC